MRSAWLVAVVWASSALAQAPAAPAGPELTEDGERKHPSAAMKPVHVDVRGAVDSDILLAYVNVGAAADAGVLQAGPGVLGFGVGFDFGTCVSLCWALNALTGLSFTHRFYVPTVRVRYDVPLGYQRQAFLQKVNVYASIYAGPVFTTMAVANRANTERIEGGAVGFNAGLGAGGQYFFVPNVFVGLEVNARLGQGRYAWQRVVGNQIGLQTDEDRWNLSGMNLRLMLGVRIP